MSRKRVRGAAGAECCLRKNGIPLTRSYFLLNAFRVAGTYLGLALRSPKPLLHSMAVAEGLRDGLHGRFGRPPWI